MQHPTITHLADAADPSVEEIQNTRRSIEGNEQAPSSRAQTLSYEFFMQQISALGSPYDVTHIPISVLEQMQRDPMIAFGLYFMHVPIMRARWHIECERAEIAEFIDRALRRILVRYITQRKQAHSFGFVPIVKRFQKENPNWTFVDPSKSDTPRKVWNNGNIEAITWKPFTALPSNPLDVEPRFNASGEFNGIKWQGGAHLLSPNVEEVDKGPKEIDLQHSLWLTNEKDSSQGSLWGYPHIGYAYRAWWSYWYRWAHYDRFFERKADPPYVVYYPGKGFGDDDGEIATMKALAIKAANDAKSGGVLAFPGQTLAGIDERLTSIREWEIKEIEVKGTLDDFLDQFNYLDVLKLRSLWIPEQALMEGQGGTSSRNVAEAEIGLHKEGSANLAQEIDEELNRWVIPDLVRANFPTFKGEVKKVTTGFTEADQQISMQIVQALAQADPAALRDIDVRELLDRVGMPLVSHKEIARKEKEIEKELAQSAPPVVDPTQGNAGVAPTPNPDEGQPQFSYVGGGGVLRLSDDQFVQSLPDSKHYKDKVVISQAKALRSRWKKEYQVIYDDFSSFLRKQDFNALEFEDDVKYATFLDAKLVPNKPGVTNWVEKKGGLPKPIADIAGDLISEKGFTTSHAIATAVNRAKELCAKGNKKYCKAVAQWEKMKLADEMHFDDADEVAKAIMDKWAYSHESLDQLINDSRAILKKAISRAGSIELENVSGDATWNPDTEVVADYLSDRSLGFVSAIDETTRADLQTYLAASLREGKAPDEIADGVRQHFADFPDWKADRLVRSEIRNSYNFATLISGEQAGVKIVQARDAQLGDTDETCMERDGKFFTVNDALVESLTEHPNGTLEWILLPGRDNLSIQYVESMPDDSDSLAYFDDENNIVYMLNDISQSNEKMYLRQLGDSLKNV